MNALLPAAALGLLAASAVAQDERSQEELVELRAEKLAKPVFEQAPWLLDYDEARAAAKRDGKWILTYFTRSYDP